MENKRFIALYPGTFDPITNGHMDILKRVLKIADKVFVCIAEHPEKTPLFELKERLDMVKQETDDLANVEVLSYNCLTVELAKKLGANTIIRGLRAVSDFEMEYQMALANRKLHPDIDTIYLMASQRYAFLSSSLVKEICRLGGDISDFVSRNVARNLSDTLIDNNKKE
jgi:pantetheine-phosphate adenylyltransferase